MGSKSPSDDHPAPLSPSSGKFKLTRTARIKKLILRGHDSAEDRKPDLETGADRVFYKDPTIPPEVKEYEEPVDLDKLLDGVTLTKLQKIFEAVMKRQQDKIDPVRSTFGTIKKEPVSLEDKIT